MCIGTWIKPVDQTRSYAETTRNAKNKKCRRKPRYFLVCQQRNNRVKITAFKMQLLLLNLIMAKCMKNIFRKKGL